MLLILGPHALAKLRSMGTDPWEPYVITALSRTKFDPLPSDHFEAQASDVGLDSSGANSLPR